jgi:hypothetical protein
MMKIRGSTASRPSASQLILTCDSFNTVQRQRRLRCGGCAQRHAVVAAIFHALLPKGSAQKALV